MLVKTDKTERFSTALRQKHGITDTFLNTIVKVRMRCGLTHPRMNKHCYIRTLSHKAKCDCKVYRKGRI